MHDTIAIGVAHARAALEDLVVLSSAIAR